MIYLPKEEFEKRALDIAIADLAKDSKPMHDGALDWRVKESRRQLVSDGFAWVYIDDDSGVNDCETCLACGALKTDDYHAGVVFECGSFLTFNMDGTIKFSDKCSKEGGQCES